MPHTAVNYTPTPNNTRPGVLDHIRGMDAAIGGATGTTNLAFANRTTTQADITSSTGADATMTSATALLAGLMPSADKAKVDFISVSQAVDLDAIEGDTADLVTLTGVAANSTALGAFAAPGNGILTGSALTIKAALQVAADAIANVPSSRQDVVATIAARNALPGNNTDIAYVVDASSDATVTAGAAMYINDGTNWQKIFEFESIDVQTNLAVANITATTLDVTSSSGANATLPAATNAAAGVATAAQIADLEDVISLTGVAGNSTDLAALMTGDVVPDAQTMLQAMIALEAAHEIGTATDAQLSAIGDARNTAGKYPGKRYRVTDRDDTIAFAQGTATNAVWADSVGMYETTPA